QDSERADELTAEAAGTEDADAGLPCERTTWAAKSTKQRRNRFHSQREASLPRATKAIHLPRFHASRAICSHAAFPRISATGMRHAAMPEPMPSIRFS